MMKNIILVMIFLIAGVLYSCNDYLDVVPDNIATIDNAFTDRNEAEKFLFTCYSYIPDQATAGGNVGIMGADELWAYYPGPYFAGWSITRGEQNINDPFMNCWDGTRDGKPLYRAIRDCNIFLENVENVNKVTDLSPSMRKRWIGEVQFLKAYYHFCLLRMYGPVVIIDKNLPISASPEEVRSKRSPVDDVIKYISDLLDTAIINLPQDILNRTTELGRITKPGALSIKARLWVTAASPLFNGNSDYTNFVDHDGVHLFNQTEDPDKWQKAVDACEAAIESCKLNSINELYKFDLPLPVSDTTRIQLGIRNSFAGKWNSEIIWGLSGKRGEGIQQDAMARLDPAFPLNNNASHDLLNPTLESTELFYTENGVPINEDKTWDYANRFNLRTATSDERVNLIENYEIAALHFNREPRFYADLAYDGSIWYMQNSPSGTDLNTWTVKARVGGQQAKLGSYNYSATGYWPKKLVNWKFVIQENGYTLEGYPWPEMRLTDLYLLYAEALNEVGRADEAIAYVDKIRARAGLKGIKESWDTYSKQGAKYAFKDGLREIIHRERAIELVFEGQRFWDLRRWKEAERVLNNQNIRGWSIDQESAAGYYRSQVLFTQKFIAPRDYFWPLREYDLIVNRKLVQNPGW